VPLRILRDLGLPVLASSSRPVRDDRGGRAYYLGSEFEVWESRIVDEVRVDEEDELCDTVRDPRRRSRVVGVRVEIQ
jgi:hypothetical protein